MFIGHARSGHSVVGALIGAHPDAVTCDELDALHYVAAGFSRRDLLALTIATAHAQARGRHKAGRDGQVYSYEVAGWWRDVWRSLRVVGDSLAGRTVQRLHESPSLIERVDALLAPTDVRYIHVVRDPFDNISTMMIRGERTFESALDRYFETCAALVDVSGLIGMDRIHTLFHESFIARPAEELRRLCAYLGLEESVAYTEACTKVVYSSPSRSSSRIAWDAAMIDRVRDRMAEYAFLQRYLDSEPAEPVQGPERGPLARPSK
jgi:hypothetical protein